MATPPANPIVRQVVFDAKLLKIDRWDETDSLRSRTHYGELIFYAGPQAVHVILRREVDDPYGNGCELDQTIAIPLAALRELFAQIDG